MVLDSLGVLIKSVLYS